ncbi:MAG TPA: hypothetical protein VGF38_23510 [Ktedonobacterales bacterium]|jgi:hypothetical protein
MASAEHITMQWWNRIIPLSQRWYVRVPYVLTFIILAFSLSLPLPSALRLAAEVAFVVSLLLLYGGGWILIVRAANAQDVPFGRWGQRAKRLFLFGAFLILAGLVCVQIVLLLPEMRIAGLVEVGIGVTVTGFSILALFVIATVVVAVIALLWVGVRLLRTGVSSFLHRLMR